MQLKTNSTTKLKNGKHQWHTKLQTNINEKIVIIAHAIFIEDL